MNTISHILNYIDLVQSADESSASVSDAILKPGIDRMLLKSDVIKLFVGCGY